MEAEKLQNIHPVTFFEDLREGMSAEYTRLVTQQEIEMFAQGRMGFPFFTSGVW